MILRHGGPSSAVKRAAIISAWLYLGVTLSILQASADSPPAITGDFDLLSAVTLTLARDPNIQVQQQAVLSSRGSLQQAAGQFDLTLNSSVQDGVSRTPYTQSRIGAGNGEEVAVTRTTTLNNSLSQQHRNGTTYSVSANVVRLEDLTDNQVYAAPTNRSSVSFSITQPLMRGKGVEATGAAERSAEITYEASKLDLRSVISQRILTVVQAYWRYVAAIEQRKNAAEAVARQEDNVGKTRRLIEGGEVAAADISQQLASLNNQQASLASAEQVLTAARNNLGLAIGLTPAEISLLPDTVPGFELLGLSDTPALHAQQHYVDLALAMRPDYQSSLLREKSTRVLLVAAEKNLQPQLDAQLQVGYAGLDEGSRFDKFPLSYGDNIRGANVTGSLSLAWPFANNAARGAYLAAQAAWQQQKLTAENLKRTITVNIATDLSAIRNSLIAVRQAEEAYGYYYQSYVNQRKKLMLGNSTILDVVTTEENYTNARLSVITAQQNLANAISQLRYDCGMLVDFRDAAGRIDLANLVSLPR